MFSTCDASEDTINVIMVVEPALAVTGDDSGMLRFWDLRRKTVTWEVKVHEDYVSMLLYHIDTEQVRSLLFRGMATTRFCCLVGFLLVLNT